MSIINGPTLADEIETAQLLLRPFQFSDVPEVFAYLQEPDMGRFLEGAQSPPTEAKTAQIIAQHILADKTQRRVWAICVERRPIGGISINFAKAHRVAEIGYSVKKSMWGRGFAGQATQAVVDAAFQAYPDLQRIQANIHPQNEASIGVAKRVGMQHEGTLRAYAYIGGQPVDEAVYAVLRQR